MATPWYQPSGSTPPGMMAPAPAAAGNPNAWQNQMTPQMQADAVRYGSSHPQWQGYSQIMQGYTPAQIMAGSAPSPSTSGSQDSLPAIQSLFSTLQGQNATQIAQLNLQKQLGLLDLQTDQKMNGLQASDLRAQTSIGMARANKMIQGAENEIQYAGAQKSFVNQLYGQANKQAGLSYGNDRANLLSDATSRGAVNAHGTVDQFTRQYENLSNTLAGNLTQKNKSLADLQKQQADAQNVAQQYGIDKQALQEKLSNGLQQFGLQNQVDLQKLLADASGLNAQKAGLAQSAITQLLQYAQGDPSLMNAASGFLAGGAGFSSGGGGQNVSAGGGRVVR